MKKKPPALHLRRLGIDTYKESVIYMREDCQVCSSEGFEVHTRVRVTLGQRSIIATINIITTDVLESGTVGLSEHAWKLLSANEGDEISVAHAKPVPSLSLVRSKIYGHALNEEELEVIMRDMIAGRYSDIHISAFLAACAGDRMNKDEILALTKAMVKVGDRLNWHQEIVVDKHCIGGLPGNRTTPIVVAIVSAFGLIMPKTSSRAITSPAGTADTMEVLAPVDIDIAGMRKVIEKEKGCVVWGGAVSLSPADDILIRVEKALDLDSEGQLVASVLSKKIAAGATHVVIDIPIGPTAKVRSTETAVLLKEMFDYTAHLLGVHVTVMFSDGIEPVGRGVGPALEARDVIAVLQCQKEAPEDLRERAITLAGAILEFSPEVSKGEGRELASDILNSGKAWKKFKAICQAQGGMREIPEATHLQSYHAQKKGKIVAIDNRRIALVAKLAGAPNDKVAGLDLHVRVGSQVNKHDKLFTIHANSPGELHYALDYLQDNHVFTID